MYIPKTIPEAEDRTFTQSILILCGLKLSLEYLDLNSCCNIVEEQCRHTETHSIKKVSVHYSE